MLTECLSSLLLILILGIVIFTRYSISIAKLIKKYKHIPGLTQRGLKGLLIGDVGTIMEQNRKGVTLHQYLANLYSISVLNFLFFIFKDFILF